MNEVLKFVERSFQSPKTNFKVFEEDFRFSIPLFFQSKRKIVFRCRMLINFFETWQTTTTRENYSRYFIKKWEVVNWFGNFVTHFFLLFFFSFVRGLVFNTQSTWSSPIETKKLRKLRNIFWECFWSIFGPIANYRRFLSSSIKPIVWLRWMRLEQRWRLEQIKSTPTQQKTWK